MKHTILGIVATEAGVASDPSQHRRAWSTRASEIRAVQAPQIPIDREHDGVPIGQVVHLERGAGGNIWLVGQVDTSPGVNVQVGEETIRVEAPIYLSAERIGTDTDEDIILRSVALTRHPARLSATPVTWFEGHLASRSGWIIRSQLHRGLLDRAAETQHTRHGGPLTIHDSQPPGRAQRNAQGIRFVDGEPVGALHYRSVKGSILSVR